LLNKNSLIPWFILVPETDVTDLLDLSSAQREHIMGECSGVSRWIKQHYKIAKINFGAIGNVVPQLHLHIIGRRENDPCWPRPVWGNLEKQKDYATEEIKSIRQRLVTDHQLIVDDDPGC